MDIRELIERFFDGATDAAEEQELRHYLQTHDVPHDIQCDKELVLSLLKAPADSKPKADFAMRMENFIENLNAEEVQGHATIYAQKRHRTHRFSLYSRYAWLAAAVVACVVIIGLQSKPAPKADACMSPDAIAEKLSVALFHTTDVLQSGIQSGRKVMLQLNNIGQANKNVMNIKTTYYQ